MTPNRRFSNRIVENTAAIHTFSATSLPSLAAWWIAVCPAVLRKSKYAPASTRVSIIDRGSDKLAAKLIGVSIKHTKINTNT